MSRPAVVLSLIVLVSSFPYTLPPVAASAHDVGVSQTGAQAWSPAAFTAGVGESVVWMNDDPRAGAPSHTVTATSPNWDVNEELSVGETFQKTFTAEGTYTYRCLFHSAMTGEVVVERGLDGSITTEILSPTPDEDGVVPVTGIVNLSVRASHPTEPITRLQARTVDGTARTITSAGTVSAPVWTAAAGVAGTVADSWKLTSSGAQGLTHTVTATAADGWVFDVTLPPGESVSVPYFDRPGTYTFRCTIHTDPAMTGKFVVSALPAPSSWGVWSDLPFEDISWRLRQDTNALHLDGPRRLVQLRAETADAYQADPTEVMLEADHAMFTIAGLGPLVDGAVLSGAVPLAISVDHPLWSPGKVEMKVWNVRAGKHYLDAGATMELQTLTSLNNNHLVRTGTTSTYRVTGSQTQTPTGQYYYPAGKWLTYNLPDGEYDLAIDVTPPAYASATTTTSHVIHVTLDNPVGAVRYADGTLGLKDLGAVAGAVTLSGTVDVPSGKTLSAVQWGLGPCGTLPNVRTFSPSGGWSTAALSGTAWSFTVDTAWPARMPNGETCAFVRATPNDNVDFTRLRVRLDVRNPLTTDLRIASVTPGPASATDVSDGSTITVVVANEGNGPVTVDPGDWKVRYKDGTTWRTVPEPAAGFAAETRTAPAWGTAHFNLTWARPTTPQVVFLGTFEVEITVDADGRIAETHPDPTVTAESNNVKEGQAHWVAAGDPRKVCGAPTTPGDCTKV